jgi:hypothetical protein
VGEQPDSIEDLKQVVQKLSSFRTFQKPGTEAIAPLSMLVEPSNRKRAPAVRVLRPDATAVFKDGFLDFLGLLEPAPSGGSSGRF